MLFFASLLCFVASTSGLALGSSRVPTVTMSLAIGDNMPRSVLNKAGVANKKAVLFFYGADDAPSCSKELASFEESLASFKASGVSVVGVRNDAGAKDYPGSLKLVVDSGDDMRNEVGIAKDFGLLGGRETFVVDGAGVIVGKHRNQFDPKSHITTSLEAVKSLQKSPKQFDIKQLAGVFGINLY